MPVNFRSRAAILTVSAAAAVILPACAGQNGNPASAQGAIQSISAADRKQGAEAHPQLLQEFGGAMTGTQATYVQNVGKTIAVQSGLSNAKGDFTVTLLNSPVNNAFAIPGGYVYVTRQLAALMNNEAELAGVLGHEVGHVAARHAAKRQSAATRNSIIGALGTLLSGAILGNNALGQIGQKIFSTGSQLLTLKYSRGQETEADNLGITYLQRAGYDPRAMSSVLQSLANQNALDASIKGTTNQVPEWASTHPDPASRVRAALTRAGTKPGKTNRDVFLAGVNGLTYGDDPAQGIVDGSNFTHPAFRMAFQAPNGFYLVNGTRAVSISGQSGKGEFSTAAYGGDLSAYVNTVFAGLSDQQMRPDSVQTTTVNGIKAAYGATRATSGSGQVDVVVFAYEWAPNQAFHFATISQAGQASQFDTMFRSIRRISATEASAVRPRKLSVVTVKAGDTVQTMAKRMAYTDKALERFLVLNGLTASSKLAAGQKVKIVIY
ncbi:M48 family metalloprotease [Novosphingobium sp. CECT 9465]|uniref:M48 family metalloprotease n=1 Tax=Novosphingobium sp. CECT 9465 TaxID=2829794 RepID=UPI001E5DCCDE|nr:M48 family metalloprotease [Novosphingobium sp. CECT 9465]CAH0496737.1 Beta-barrel assembly-enhancing protease [Novosphingobium sp. CECT 9465]